MTCTKETSILKLISSVMKVDVPYLQPLTLNIATHLA